MAISLLDNFNLGAKKPNFARDLFDTVADMVAYSENYLPDVFECNVKENGNRYRYNVNNTVDAVTGKWRLVGGGGGSDLPEVINNRFLHTNANTGELEWSTVNSEESIDLDIGESNPSEYLWSEEYKTVRYSLPYGRGYDDYLPDTDNFSSRADYFTGVIYNLEDSCIIKGSVNHFENKIKYTYIGVVDTDGEIRWSCEYEDKNIKQYFNYEFPDATNKDRNKIAFDKDDNEFKICKEEPQNYLRYINSENDDICIVSLKDYSKVYLFNNNTCMITPTNYYIIMDSEDSFYYEDEDYNVHNFTSDNFINYECGSIYYWDSYNIGSSLPVPEVDDKILISYNNHWNQISKEDFLSDKQDNLPAVTNDRYLHTNAITGELEWSSIGDSVEIDDTTTSTDKVWSSNKVNDELSDKQDEIPTYTLAEYEAIKDTIPEGTIFNISDDKTQVTNITNNKYSTDEVVCGEWIDGKPIYRKVLTALQFPKVTADDGKIKAKNYDISELNVDTMITTTMSQIWGDFNAIRFNMINPLPTFIQVATNAITSSEAPFKFIIEYTKTTD